MQEACPWSDQEMPVSIFNHAVGDQTSMLLGIKPLCCWGSNLHAVGDQTSMLLGIKPPCALHTSNDIHAYLNNLIYTLGGGGLLLFNIFTFFFLSYVYIHGI